MIYWTDLGREHLLLCLIDPRRRQYTLIANTPKYEQQVKTDDLIALMQKVIDVNKNKVVKTRVKAYMPNGRKLLAYVECGGDTTNDLLD
jgi:dUTPase